MTQSMGTDDPTLSMLFFPFMTPGHMLPMLDMAKLFAARGVSCTVLTTPANAALIRSSLDRRSIKIHLIQFPSVAVGLPEGCENLYSVPSPDLEPNFFKASGMLREPFDGVLKELLPDCVVTDMFLPWTYYFAAELEIPTLMFNGFGFFSLCCYNVVNHLNRLKSLPAEAESFVLPGLPHPITMLKSQFQVDLAKERPDIFEIVIQLAQVEPKCYGVVMNTFYEMEPDYAKHYREVIGRRSWHLGPVSLCNSDMVDRCSRGNNATSCDKTCLDWLDAKSPGSVVYVCFGSGCHFSMAQLCEIALGLEAADHPFIWVVRRDLEGWMPEGYEERIEGKGLIMRGWAPQMLILNHEAVGGFVTHCGWNSILEGVSAGLPFVTWPQFADQFFNEKLIVDILDIGVAIGIKNAVADHEKRHVVEATTIEFAIRELMGSKEDGKDRRSRARKLGEMARGALEIGGSSYADMDNLIHELRERHTAHKQRVKLIIVGQGS